MISTTTQIHVLLLTGLAAACGAAIGLERERSGKVAGLRTHILVSAASAMATGAGAAVVGTHGDPTRILHGVITGIGFLGTGVIFRDDRQPSGITSAATIMLTAMVGAACGIGAPILAIGATTFALVTLWYARRVECRLNERWERQDRRRHRARRQSMTMRDLRRLAPIDLRDEPDASIRPNPRPSPRPQVRTESPEPRVQRASSNL